MGRCLASEMWDELVKTEARMEVLNAFRCLCVYFGFALHAPFVKKSTGDDPDIPIS